MKKNLFKLSFILIFVWFLLAAGQAEADTATTTIRLQIKTNDASLYDQNIDVTACPEADGSATSTINVRCAVDQTGLTDPSDWIYGGTFLNSLKGTYASDFSNNKSWGWFSNLEYGQVSMTQHILTSGEKLLLTYNVNPLKISVDNAAPYVNATSTITLEQFGLDESWSPVWSPAASSTLVIAGLDAENVSGVYEYTATTTALVLIYGKKSGYIDSNDIAITAQEAPADDNKNNNLSSGGSVIIPAASGGNITDIVLPLKVDLGKAIDFLIAKQKADGSFGAILQTDWAAIALASANPNGAAAQKAKSYLFIDQDPLAGMNLVSDYARRAMALMSLNINPYNGTKTNYIEKIIDLFDGRQFGDASLYNDDIFAFLVLNRAGYGADDEIIKKTVDFIIAKQQADGSWSGSDLTAAAIQALTSMSSLDGVNASLQKARNFLANAQGADGGFGNTYTTSWVMQAIAARSESSGTWKKSNNTPESYLALSQGVDGGLEKDDTYEANRVWSTAYAIPAVQGKPWFNIMNNFSKAENRSAASANLNASNNPVATSTLEKLDLATSSPENLITATSTESLIQPQADEVKAETETVKRAEPKVLAVKIILAKPPSVAVSKVKKKSEQPIQSTASVKGISDSAAPAVSPPAPKTNFLALTGRLIYRGLRYFLNLLGF